MKPYRKAIVAVALFLLLPAGIARAQCLFGHPKSTKTIHSDLVQDFVPCGSWNHCEDEYNTPNTATENPIAACEPPQTWSQRNGDPPDGWRFGPNGRGSYTFKALGRPPMRFGGTDPNSVDFAVMLRLSDVVDRAGNPANGFGSLKANVRVTFDNRVGGDMTVATLPVTFHFTLENGRAKLKSTFDEVWGYNGWSQPELPPCTTVAIESARVVDGNVNSFAVPGMHLN